MLIKRVLRRLIRGTSLERWRFYRSGVKNGMELGTTPKPKIYFLMIPTYGNIGDQAIALGTEFFLGCNMQGYEVVKVRLQDTYKAMYSIEKAIDLKNDIVVLQGGGNFGDAYQFIENARRFICSHLSKARIISMPVTAHFSSKKQLSLSKRIYEKCENLTVFAREKKSYDYLINNFQKMRIVLTPDIAFSLKGKFESLESARRETVLLCVRADVESNMPEIREKAILEFLKKFPNSILGDTTVTRDISDALRADEVRSFVTLLKSSRMVITDRMHSMILCVITGTPCVVIKSKDWKIKGTYEWVKNLSYIKYLESPDAANVELLPVPSANEIPNFDYSSLIDALKGDLK